MSAAPILPGIFKAYDIRGVVHSTLTADAVRPIGAALGSEARDKGIATICVGRDGRLSGPMLRDALVAGITSTGTDVIDVGMVPTPVLYFSTVQLETGSGVEITGSHKSPCSDFRGPLCPQIRVNPRLRPLKAQEGPIVRLLDQPASPASFKAASTSDCEMR